MLLLPVIRTFISHLPFNTHVYKICDPKITELCPNKDKIPKCTNSSGSHAANYRVINYIILLLQHSFTSARSKPLNLKGKQTSVYSKTSDNSPVERITDKAFSAGNSKNPS